MACRRPLLYLVVNLHWGFLTFLSLLFALSPAPGHAQDRTPSLFDTLHNLGDVRLRLTYPFDSLYRTNREEVDAVISIGSGDDWLLENKEMTLNLRGKFRRMKCTAMPPLLLNFKKGDLRDLGLSSIDEFKLVTHCVDGSEGIENLQEERLCYQAYASVAPYAYRTVWVTVTYCDMNDPSDCQSSSGFLIESDKDIRRRYGIEERKLFNVSQDSLEYDSYRNAAAFNFLIGNRDWSVVASRNAKLFLNPAIGKYITIPYDFDFANIVGASYRREPVAKNKTHPFDRIYEGEYFAARAAEMLKGFAEREATLLEAVRTAQNPIDDKRRGRIVEYLENGFKYIRKTREEDLRYGSVCPYKGNL